MSDYTFNEYSTAIEFTRAGIHNTPAYNCLGLIGELGELIAVVIRNLPEPKAQEEREVLNRLTAFVAFAEITEKLKKSTRKSQIRTFPETAISESDVSAFLEELGGVTWYLDTLASGLGFNLGEAAKANQELLERRFGHNPNWMLGGEKLH